MARISLETYWNLRHSRSFSIGHGLVKFAIRTAWAVVQQSKRAIDVSKGVDAGHFDQPLHPCTSETVTCCILAVATSFRST